MKKTDTGKKRFSEFSKEGNEDTWLGMGGGRELSHLPWYYNSS